MNGRTASRVLLVLLLVVAAVAIGVGGYNVGYQAGAAATAAGEAGRAVPYPFYGPLGFHAGMGWGFFGLLFPILFFVLIFLLVRAAFWSGRSRRYGPWAYDDRPRGPGADLDAWHRRVHGDESGQATGAGEPPDRSR